MISKLKAEHTYIIKTGSRRIRAEREKDTEIKQDTRVEPGSEMGNGREVLFLDTDQITISPSTWGRADGMKEGRMVGSRKWENTQVICSHADGRGQK